MKNSSVPARILLIDDSRDGLLIRRALLEEQGYVVEVAASGEEGFTRFQENIWDVVVTDYRMPGINGVDLIKQMRGLRAAAPIVLLSGFVLPLGLTEENTGADAVVAKTANESAHLLRAIKRLVTAARVKRKPPTSQGGGATSLRRRLASL
ncbi:MAG TPA: response regulator [Bryobacteraceae bacterium]|jgi:CheY-like chemotaxis protein|nr:response regulator [Bryobacteraceae bacterium]